jgi:hypothetical protein
VKNAAFVSFIQGVLRLAEDGPADYHRTAEYYRDAVDAAKKSITDTLGSWTPGPAQAEMLDAVRSIEAEQALTAHG